MKKYLSTLLLFTLLINISCSKEDTGINEDFEVSTSDEINHFIYKGLNLYYLWQKDVPDLADNRFNNLEELYTYFRKYDTPEATFNSLLSQPGVVDRFSWIVDDYVALENSFQGINLSTGMEFGLVRYTNSSTNIFGYIRYVIPNSSASSSGLTRGMYFNSINGIQLTDSNFRELLFSNDTSFSLGLADYNNGNPINNNNTIILDKTEVQENPIAVSKVITDGTQKIGYLMYNQFASSYDQDLNAAFSNFKAEAVNDLIIDLRYNGGGSTSTAGYLGSMVTGQFTGEVYSKEVWNDKVLDAFSPDNFINNFPTRITKTDANDNIVVDEAINSLNLSRVYFIVSGSSASASELVINALDAYIDVKIVGTTTVGKQVGSITLYDSDNLFRSGDNLNTEHTYAMQPLVLEITNKDGKNYPNGIVPGTNFTGINLGEDIGNLGVLGERSDPLLDRTLEYISTGAKSSAKTKDFIKTEEIFNSKLATPAKNNMYSELK
ncbi:S41 family peptidase [Polaribacter sp. KT 15]|uniref:S41 family peptidase n=1 Tax=Polaribacter sp. KT 15 TaxID=1896175 RepID=UPI000909CEC1|nr:S41 family peptidase [Polaribacter sp. KT 15]SHN07815.1 C-terminal processing protease CtpA/Prc, contains a PDZ domain [Polaribacter sp. KT 15]